ncbi:MAG: PmoA family protein [Planctomycetes bacterium]|nr:PmoA family protein [Planctomycetota bacterium]
MSSVSSSLHLSTSLLILATVASLATGQETSIARSPNRCEIVPQAGHQVSFQIDGVEKIRWHYGDQYPRPFFFPFNGPSGTSLTRMGHPGAQNHDHHQSVWFAHNKVNGLDFWANGKGTQIRQKMWYAYEDGDSEAIMASVSGWYDPADKEVMEQEIVAALLPLANNEHALELQITMRPSTKVETVELEKTNFGFLAVRVAKTLSAHFGGGTLMNSEGQADEKNIFAKQSRWMDYSGPVAVGQGSARRTVTEGITYFDHPKNPRYPTYWHVREDGWMGASFGMHEGVTLEKDIPLTLRYLLHAHSGAYDHDKAERVQKAFAARFGFEVSRGTRKHRQFEVKRRAE